MKWKSPLCSVKARQDTQLIFPEILPVITPTVIPSVHVHVLVMGTPLLLATVSRWSPMGQKSVAAIERRLYMYVFLELELQLRM